MVEKGRNGSELVRGLTSSMGGVGMRCAGMGGIIGLRTICGQCMTVKYTDGCIQLGPWHARVGPALRDSQLRGNLARLRLG